MNQPTKNMTPGVCAPEAQLPTTDNVVEHTDSFSPSSAQPMHSTCPEQAKEYGMSCALLVTSLADRHAIIDALLRGFNDHHGIRAEDALSAVGFTWPPSATPRSLGAIVSKLARTGQIVETGLTKGRSGRSRAGRVSLWVRSPR
jgi:hypothetical protein